MRLVLENLTKTYGYLPVLQGLSWEFGSGPVHVVTGPNGVGKTTLLCLLAGLLRPTAGTIRLELSAEGLAPVQRKLHLGLLSPRVNLYPNLTVLENLTFFAQLRGVTQSLDPLLHRLELTPVCHRPLGTLSTGVRQRAKLAFALLHEPQLLLLDEPTANLDVRGRQVVEDIIAEQRERGLIIVATNDPVEVEKMGQQVLALQPPQRQGE